MMPKDNYLSNFITSSLSSLLYMSIDTALSGLFVWRWWWSPCNLDQPYKIHLSGWSLQKGSAPPSPSQGSSLIRELVSDVRSSDPATAKFCHQKMWWAIRICMNILASCFKLQSTLKSDPLPPKSNHSSPISEKFPQNWAKYKIW